MINLLKSTIRTIKTLILAIILICLIIFMVNNRDAVTIHLYPLPFEVDTKIFMIMLAFFLLGILFGMLACSKSLLNSMFTGFKDKQKIKKLETQINKK